MGLSATEIILEYVCPGLGAIAANIMFSSALRDCRDKVEAGQGLQALNVRKERGRCAIGKELVQLL